MTLPKDRNGTDPPNDRTTCLNHDRPELFSRAISLESLDICNHQLVNKVPRHQCIGHPDPRGCSDLELRGNVHARSQAGGSKQVNEDKQSRFQGTIIFGGISRS